MILSSRANGNAHEILLNEAVVELVPGESTFLRANWFRASGTSGEVTWFPPALSLPVFGITRQGFTLYSKNPQ